MPSFCVLSFSGWVFIKAWALKGSQLGAFCPYAVVYCYLELKLHYLKNLKLFSIRVKELFEPTVLRKTKGDRFLLF